MPLPELSNFVIDGSVTFKRLSRHKIAIIGWHPYSVAGHYSISVNVNKAAHGVAGSKLSATAARTPMTHITASAVITKRRTGK